MSTHNEDAYWMAFAHAKNMSRQRKMGFLIDVVHGKGISLNRAIEALKSGERLGFTFNEAEWRGLSEAIADLPNYGFLAEEIANQHISLLPVMAEGYPKTLKRNLKANAPILLYCKGNTTLLSKPAAAIVGARKSGKPALDFTKAVAQTVVGQGHVVVSGGAKGVDQHALDTAVEQEGESIVVLPEGILTRTPKKYYKALVRGKVLLTSTYHPRAAWSVGLAMDRNKTVYGMADKIYVAESNSSGGTWEGVISGLQAGRTVYVRQPEPGERNANVELIGRGAIAVDSIGEMIYDTVSRVDEPQTNRLADSGQTSIQSASTLIPAVIDLLQTRAGRGMTTADIRASLDLTENLSKRLTTILNKAEGLTLKKNGGINVYVLKVDAPELF